MFRIKTFNRIASRGLEAFPAAAFEVGPDLAQPHALMLRSHSLHGEAIAPDLLAVARCGAGVNNIPVDKMSKCGVPVFNAPGANARRTLDTGTAVTFTRTVVAPNRQLPPDLAQRQVNPLDLPGFSLRR